MSESNDSIQYVKKTVCVTRNGSELTITPNPIDLRDWEWVEWEFKDLQDGEFGFISFAPPEPRLGPFYSLRSLDHKHFLGKGHKATQGGKSYGYRVLYLHPDQSKAVASGEGTIHDRATLENTTPEIHVAYREERNEKNEVTARFLTVTPDPVGLNWGDTATWVFENLPPNAFACFEFTPASNAPEMNTGTGPFVAFNASTGDPEVTVRANAMGFAAGYRDPEIYPRFTYHIELRDWEGNLLASHDPAIDNLGPPPPDGNKEGGE